jgi:4-hydroxybenzoate polyprenyltransferase
MPIAAAAGLIYIRLLFLHETFHLLTHFILAPRCGGAPVGGRGSVPSRVPCVCCLFVLGGAVCFWVAGFDILYATQDIDFDRREDFIPSPRASAAPARCGSRAFLTLRQSAAFSLRPFCGRRASVPRRRAAVSVLLFIEHWCMLEDNRKKMNFITYNMNQIVSLTFFDSPYWISF